MRSHSLRVRARPIRQPVGRDVDGRVATGARPLAIKARAAHPVGGIGGKLGEAHVGLEEEVAVRREEAEVGGAQPLEQVVHALPRPGALHVSVDLFSNTRHQALGLEEVLGGGGSIGRVLPHLLEEEGVLADALDGLDEVRLERQPAAFLLGDGEEAAEGGISRERLPERLQCILILLAVDRVCGGGGGGGKLEAEGGGPCAPEEVMVG